MSGFSGTKLSAEAFWIIRRSIMAVEDSSVAAANWLRQSIFDVSIAK